jgi:hypothetical protein
MTEASRGGFFGPNNVWRRDALQTIFAAMMVELADGVTSSRAHSDVG